MFRIISIAFIIIFIAGCATTDDPRQGGLFSYWQHGEQAYQKRIDYRQQQLSYITSQQQAAQNQTVHLQTEKQALTNELARYQQDLADTEKELNDLTIAIENTKTLTSEKLLQKQNSEKKLALLRSEMEKLKKDHAINTQEKQQKLKVLKEELEALLKIAAEL